MSQMIESIIVVPPLARPGMAVRVEVVGSAEASVDTLIAEVTINGIPGAVQYLQFPTVGTRRLRVVATSATGQTQTETATVDVDGPDVRFRSLHGVLDIAMLGVTQAIAQPYEAVLTLGSLIDTRSPRPKPPRDAIAPGRWGAQFADLQLVQPKAATAMSALFESKGGQPVQVHARRMTRITSRRCPRKGANTSTSTSGSNTARRQPALARTMLSAVYDLGTIDLGELLAGQGDRGGHGSKQEYEWDFGDGTSAVTRTPTVRHDYFASIDHERGTGQFVVTCNARHSNVAVRRTLTIQSAYKLCKQRGTIAPHVVSDLFAHKRYHLMVASLVVHNVEREPLVLDRMSVTALSDDLDAVALPSPFVLLGQGIVVPPRSKAVVGVNVPFVVGAPTTGQLSHDIKGFTVLYAGHCANVPVRCNAVFDIPVREWPTKPTAPLPGKLPELYREPWPWEMVQQGIDAIVRDPASGLSRNAVTIDQRSWTVSVTHAGLAPAPARVLGQVLEIQGALLAPADITAMAYREQRVHREATAAAAQPGIDLAGPATRLLQRVPLPLFGGGRGMQAMMGGPPASGPVAEGEVCDPDNLDEVQLALADGGQLVCQSTTEVMDVLMPARWMNARKGDVLLSPGGDGIIGGLMLNVSPPQWYSHSGIMTRNYDEITHSTGSQARLMDHLRGIADGSDGFEPHILKYIWPGAITQTVENSVDGESFPDPEYNKSYSIAAFGPLTVGVTHNDQMKMIPPLVLKPDPMQESPAVRTALHMIAADARMNAGRPGVVGQYHYRWFSYTDPSIGQGPVEGPLAGWAAGTRASVCSSYIWMHARSRSGKLESGQALVTPTDLELADLATGASVRPVTQEGLYTYTANERLAAGEWLYDMIYNQAYEKAGWLGNILTDAADDISNQFLNAFANGDCDAKDDDKWRQTTDADAISPDDMMWWDGPESGGLYGFLEPAKFREARIETYTVSRWRKVLSRGRIHGRVFDAGVPVAGAMVQVYEGKTDFTDGAGQYELNDVPLGPYTIKAQKVINAVLKTAEAPKILDAAELTVDIALQEPPERYRIAQVFIDFWGRDYETFDSDEIKDPGPEYFELYLGPDKLTNTAHRTYKWGGEMRLEYTFTVRLLVNNTVDVDVHGLLYEGTSEDTTDLDGTGSTTFQVPLEATRGATLTITNTQEDDDDEGQLAISVKNVRNSA